MLVAQIRCRSQSAARRGRCGLRAITQAQQKGGQAEPHRGPALGGRRLSSWDLCLIRAQLRTSGSARLLGCWPAGRSTATCSARCGVRGCSVPGVKRGRDLSWLKDRRVIVFGIGCALAGFLAALLIFGKPWHLPPDWGDIPTWLAVLVASVGGWIALSQLRAQQRQINAEAERSGQRDELLNRQLEEAEQRSRANRRRQAERVYLRVLTAVAGGAAICEITNASDRPIRWVKCRRLEPGYEAYPDAWWIGVETENAVPAPKPADMMA